MQEYIRYILAKRTKVVHFKEGSQVRSGVVNASFHGISLHAFLGEFLAQERVCQRPFRVRSCFRVKSVTEKVPIMAEIRDDTGCPSRQLGG